MSPLYSAVLSSDGLFADLIDLRGLYGAGRLRLTVDRGSVRLSAGAAPDALDVIGDYSVGVFEVSIPLTRLVKVERLTGNSSTILVEILPHTADKRNVIATLSDGGVGGFMLSAGSAKARLPAVAKNSACARRLNGSIQVLEAATGRTYMSLFRLPYDVIAVQPVFFNSSATALLGVKASVATHSSVAAVSGALIQAKVSGDSTFTIPAATSGAGTNQHIDGMVVCDVIPLQTVPRSDGEDGRLVELRTQIPTGTNAQQLVFARFPSNFTVDQTAFVQRYAEGDVTTPGNEAVAFIQHYQSIPCALMSYTSAGVVSVMAVGDSITGGTGGGTYGGSLEQACRSLILAGKPVDFSVCGYPGQYSDNFFINGCNQLDTYKPSIAFLSVGSPNDTDKYTAAWKARMLYMAVDWIGRCAARNIIPGLMTIPPTIGTNSAQETVRRSLVAETISLAANSGAVLHDRSALWTNNDSASGGYISGMTDDGIHPNMTGYALEIAQYKSIISGFI